MHKINAVIAPIFLRTDDTNAHQRQECAVAEEMLSNDRNAHQQLAGKPNTAVIAPGGLLGMVGDQLHLGLQLGRLLLRLDAQEHCSYCTYPPREQ